MRSFEFERWDHGRVVINAEFADIFRRRGLTTVADLMNFEGGQIAKNLLRERVTTRFELLLGNGERQGFYVKRHAAPPWKEYVKPWFRLTRPILGAGNEWAAILRFHQLGLPTMTPVAFGQSGWSSCLVTLAIEGCIKLSDWVEARFPAVDQRSELTGGLTPPNRPLPVEETLAQTGFLADRIAGIARTMHQAGLHHQDFYLTHLMVPREDVRQTLYVIDLGRVRQRRRLGRRWIVKDLAQLHYSARRLPSEIWPRFLQRYLERSITPQDEVLSRRVLRKSRAISRHTQKNRL